MKIISVTSLLCTSEIGSYQNLCCLIIFVILVLTGDDLYDSAVRFRLPYFPAFALEVLPNRDSLVYGDIYKIGDEASTIFRGTLRYEGMAVTFALNLDRFLYHF